MRTSTTYLGLAMTLIHLSACSSRPANQSSKTDGDATTASMMNSAEKLVLEKRLIDRLTGIPYENAAAQLITLLDLLMQSKPSADADLNKTVPFQRMDYADYSNTYMACEVRKIDKEDCHNLIMAYVESGRTHPGVYLNASILVDYYGVQTATIYGTQDNFEMHVSLPDQSVVKLKYKTNDLTAIPSDEGRRVSISSLSPQQLRTLLAARSIGTVANTATIKALRSREKMGAFTLIMEAQEDVIRFMRD